ncbi:MAG: hypothetical protein K2X98_01520 [Alphaproteobacteria bacterium]|nr:hypothetical protein [Alphaproteobacteria bacterium]
MKNNFFIILLLSSLNFSVQSNEPKTHKKNESQEKMPVLITKGYRILSKKNTSSPNRDDNADLSFNPSGMNPKEMMSSPQHTKHNQENDALLVPENEEDSIDYKKISVLVTTIKKNLCAVNHEGSYEVWLQIEGGASGVFVSASAQTGIKAIINCALKSETGSTKSN